MLHYLLKRVSVYLHIYMLPKITFGYNILFDILINIKLIVFIIIKKHS